MAHFAKIGEGNIVETVVVVHNDVATTEQAGIDFLKNLYKDPSATWVQTSYNGNFRKQFAGIGSTYDVENDRFLPRKIYPSLIFNEEKYMYEPPVPIPDDHAEKHYDWDEESLSWVEIPEES